MSIENELSDRRFVQQANSLRVVEVAGQFVTYGQPVFGGKGKKVGFTCALTLLASFQDASLVNPEHPLIELAKLDLSGFTSTRPHSAKGPTETRQTGDSPGQETH